jgi:hypothetical protein
MSVHLPKTMVIIYIHTIRHHPQSGVVGTDAKWEDHPWISRPESPHLLVPSIWIKIGLHLLAMACSQTQ